MNIKMNKRKVIKSIFGLLPLMSILICGGYLRVLAALKYPFWLDEANIFLNSRFIPLKDLLLLNYSDTAHPPGFPVLMHFWQKIGTTPFFARIPSLIFSILILYLVYLIGKELIDRKFGLICTTVFAFSNFMISLSWQAKSYPFVIFFTLSSILLYLRNITTISKALLFTLVNILGFFFDYGFIWYFSSLLLFESLRLIVHIKSIRQYIKQNGTRLLAIANSAMLMFLWWPIFISRFSQAMRLEEYLSESTLTMLFSEAIEKFVAISGELPYGFVYFLIFTMLTGLALGLYSSNNKNKQFVVLQFISIMFPLLISFSISILYRPIIVPRNLYIVCFALLFGWAYFIYLISQILFKESIVKRYLIVLVLIGFWICINLFSFNDMSHSNSDIRNWEEVGELIEKYDSGSPKLNIFLDTRHESFTSLRYYLLGFNKKTQNTSKIDFLYYFRDEKEFILAKDELKQNKSIWLFDRNKDRKSLDNSARYVKCNKKDEFSVEEMLIYLCEE